MRGFAASWVVFYHLWNRYFPAMSTQGHPLRVVPEASVEFYVTFFLFQ
jgi:hypothetical protein